MKCKFSSTVHRPQFTKKNEEGNVKFPSSLFFC